MSQSAHQCSPDLSDWLRAETVAQSETMNHDGIFPGASGRKKSSEEHVGSVGRGVTTALYCYEERPLRGSQQTEKAEQREEPPTQDYGGIAKST